MEVREASGDELREAGRVTQAAYREFARPGDAAWERYFAHLGDAVGRAEHAAVLLAVDAGRIVGTVTLELDSTIDGDGRLEPEQANIRMLAVDPSCRGRGIGRRLVEECLARARACGRTVVTLQTTDEMVAASALYRSLGFERDPGTDVEVAPNVLLRGYRLPLR